MSLLEILIVVYLIIGVICWGTFIVNGWNTGEASEFLLQFVMGFILGIAWLPVLIIFCVFGGFVMFVQFIMDFFNEAC